MSLRFLTALILSFGFSVLQAQESVRYEVSFINATQHLAKVDIYFPAMTQENPMVKMANWRTGKYQILPLANGIRDIKAMRADGSPLAIEKKDKASWQVTLESNTPFHVSYELYANELGSRTRHIDETHAYLDATATFLFMDESRPLPIEVKINPLNHWVSRSGMNKGSCDHCFIAADFDVLASSPIETGMHDFLSATVNGKAIELLIWGKGNYNAQKMMDDLSAIAKTTLNMFEGAPFERYLFIVHATDGERGATEHLNSTVMQRSRWSFHERKDYLSFIRTAAHEFFHTWNVKGYRPSGLVPYDYQSENYSRLLWVSEGHTSYFDNLITLRAGIQTKKEYLAELGSSLEKYLKTPGRFQQSALESSFDEWIQPDGDRHLNAAVSIYPKGEMLALAMDLSLRKSSKGKIGLEKLHQHLWKNHKVSQGGFGSNDLLQILGNLSEDDWQSFWAQYIEGTEELPLLALLSDAGLSFDFSKPTEDESPHYSEWGIDIESGSDKEFVKVTQVTKDGPAWLAGLVSGDVLVAIDEHLVSAGQFKSRVQSLDKERISVKLYRRGVFVEIFVTPEKRVAEKRKLKIKDKVKSAEQKLQNVWLGK